MLPRPLKFNLAGGREGKGQGGGGGGGLASFCLLNFDVICQQMFSMPLFHVFLQGAVNTEGHLANVAAVDLLPYLAMRFHVTRQLTALGTCIVAELAFVRPLSSVAPTVHRQIAAVLKDLATVLTCIAPAPFLRAGSPGARTTDVGGAASAGCAAAP